MDGPDGRLVVVHCHHPQHHRLEHQYSDPVLGRNQVKGQGHAPARNGGEVDTPGSGVGGRQVCVPDEDMELNFILKRGLRVRGRLMSLCFQKSSLRQQI